MQAVSAATAGTGGRRSARSSLPSPPSDDRRWRAVDSRIRRLGGKPDGLIEVLHAVQEAFGHLDRDALAYVSASLRVPLSKVFGVATFYSYFTLEPAGEHTCVVCTGTVCYIDGAAGLLAAVKAEFEVGPGETSADGRLSVLTVRCVGSCSLSPLVIVDGETSGRLTPAGVVARLHETLATGAS
ncbi:MAG TPA: NAD(P)H-dependent oxidoreductase subunit E [Acidimicrobiales bacterium]|nr:NAD(P)H-dependent oxidoreductase subunit E [Acidimicrobiales bacterium]